MNTRNEIETLTALLICAASELGEADHLDLPAWALSDDGSPNFTAITSAGRELLQLRSRLSECAADQATDISSEAERAQSINSVGEMIDKAYAVSKITAVVLAFGIHCASGRGVVNATRYALQDCEIA